jgi:pyridoxine 5-phosphate synthase
MNLKLGVNIDHVATLRQARGGFYPDPVQAAKICQKAGADSIVMHLREDRRHIQDRDLFRVQKVIQIKLNLEMSIAPSVVRTALALLPDQVTLVPEKRQERTTEGGLNLFKKRYDLWKVLESFQKKNIAVSLFLDPNLKQIREARRLGVEAVELHTGDYANQKTGVGHRKQLARLREAARLSANLGLLTYAGHGLDYENTRAVARIREIEELNIGYSIITRSLWVGLARAVRQMRALMHR